MELALFPGGAILFDNIHYRFLLIKQPNNVNPILGKAQRTEIFVSYSFLPCMDNSKTLLKKHGTVVPVVLRKVSKF